jgi:pullulanase-type alpha-1,6-glucosidase
VLAWARHYRIDSFRFDLMGHQPRAAMERLRDRLKRELGRDIPLIGEGWNFGEIADGKRFMQASQLSLSGTGIATFSDRARDAARGGGHADSGANLVALQGYLNGLSLDPNAMNTGRDQREALLKSSDLLRVGLLGSIAKLNLTDYRGNIKPLSAFDYNGQAAGYVAEPGEVVNYVENHDNQTLFDINALRLPRGTSKDDRARMQVLGGALTLFSQGVAYVHAGIEILRSKSLDRNSFDSGDHFNRIDWSYNSNNFAQGLPPFEGDAAKDDPILAEALNDPRINPTKKEILWTRDAFLDLLRIRASSTLFRLRSAKDIEQRVTLLNTGPDQVPGLLGALIDGAGYAGANFKRVAYFINAAPVPATLVVPHTASSDFELHPVHRAQTGADKRVQREAKFDAVRTTFRIPARSAVVFVVH